MGWYGGTHGRSRRKKCVNEVCARLDANLFRAALCDAGWKTPVSFSTFWKDREVTLDMSKYDSRPSTDHRPDHVYVGELDLIPVETPLYGRPRWFFKCSDCGTLRRFLYASTAQTRFTCRDCLGLTYASTQRWDHMQRTGRVPGRLGRMFQEISEGGDGDKAMFGRVRPRRIRPR